MRSFCREPSIPITISQPLAIAAAQQAVREERQLGLLMPREAGVAEPSAIDLHRVGTVANVLRYLTRPMARIISSSRACSDFASKSSCGSARSSSRASRASRSRIRARPKSKPASGI